MIEGVGVKIGRDDRRSGVKIGRDQKEWGKDRKGSEGVG